MKVSAMDVASLSFIATEDYRKLFQATPTPFLVLTPKFTIAAVSDSYLGATMSASQVLE